MSTSARVGRTLSLIVTLVLVGMLAHHDSARGESDSKRVAAAPGSTEVHLERVIVFKDGYGLVIEKLRGQADSHGRLFTDRVPDSAVFGSLWASAEGRELLSTSGDWGEAVDDASGELCLSYLELLRANVGRVVSLELEKGELSGKLLQVLEPPSPEAAAQAPTAIPVGAEDLANVARLPGGFESGAAGNPLLVVETDHERKVVPAGLVRSVGGKELRLQCHHPQRTKRLTFDLGSGAAGKKVELNLMYFTPGFRWIPTYRVGTESSGKADVALQGEVINDEEDLDGVPVDLVVGVPNFRFKSVVSPLILERALRQTLQQAAPELMTQMTLSNAFHYAPTDAAPSLLGASAPVALAPELSTESAQDLFLYGIPSLTLHKCNESDWLRS